MITIDRDYAGNYMISGTNGILLCKSKTLEAAIAIRDVLMGEELTKLDREMALVAIRAFDAADLARREARKKKNTKRGP